MVKFYDTNYLIELGSNIFDNLGTKDKIVTSSVCLMEMEHIKTSKNKDDSVKYKTRKATHALDNNLDTIDVVVYDEKIEKYIIEKGLIPDKPDIQICACAAYLRDEYDLEDLVFYTKDLSCKVIAKKVFGLNIGDDTNNAEEKYTGFKEIVMSDEDMAYFYEHQEENIYGLLINEYLIIKNNNSEVVDILRWDGIEYNAVSFPKIKTNYFGDIKPYNKDVYQQLVLNSLDKNQLTMIKGPAGTGKSYLALGYLFWLLEKHKIDKIVMFVNPTPTANAAKLGFLPGSQLEKLVDSSVGNMLAGKLGDKVIIDQLVLQNKLTILPMCDIRGYDTTGQNCAVYITEAQNMDISLMKLALQRIGEDTKVIIDGDYNAQVDLIQYSGYNNGMKRMSEVFRGQDFYGEIELKNIYRSRIALIAEEM